MTITLTLTPEVEHKLREKAAQRGVTLEEYVLWLAEQYAADPVTPTAPPEEREALWREWAASHQALPHAVDDSRESIYEGRGE